MKVFKIRNYDDKILKQLGHKKNSNGYSKQLFKRKFVFLDILYSDGIVTKAKLVDKHFIFVPANKKDVSDLMEFNLVREVKIEKIKY